MPVWLQADTIKAARIEFDDESTSKFVFGFSPLQGKLDGINKVFAIPQMRINPVTLKIYLNEIPTTGFSVTDAKAGLLEFTTAPKPEENLSASFNYTWFDDVEWDHHLNRAANELGYSTYHTNAATVSGSESADLITDFPYGLRGALILLAASKAARALASRFAVRYDTSSGDQDFSTSQMAEKYSQLTEQWEKRGLEARDAFYQGQGRQYQPSAKDTGYFLPAYAPRR